MEPLEGSPQQDLRAYLRVLNRRKLTISTVTVLIVGLALAYSLVKTPIYTADTMVLVPEQSAGSALQPAANQQLPATASLQRTLSDAQQFALGDQTKAAAQAILHSKAKVVVVASTTTDVLTFTYASASKTIAATTANGYATAFIRANRTNQIAQYTSQVKAIQASIATLQHGVAGLAAGSQQASAAQASITSLTEDLQQLQATSQLVAATSPTIINAAVPPKFPSSPNLTRDTAFALIVGLLLGVGLGFIRERLDDKVSSISDVEGSSGGHPVVGSIPDVNSWRRGSGTHVALLEDTDSAVSEAYRTLRTAVQFLGIDDPQRVIGITSSTPDEGKSTTTANLAVSFARAGQQVIAMSCDFRRPRLHLFFGLDNQTGATSVLLGQTTLQDAIRDVDDEPNLRVLPSGPVPPNPAEILSLDRVRQLINLLGDNADVLLIDCPPVLPVTDTLLISRLCDTMLVMAVANNTKREDLLRCHELLSQVKAPVRGTIVNRVPIRGPRSLGYGYGYGDGYRHTADNNPASHDADPGSSRNGDPSAEPASGRETQRDLVRRLSLADRVAGRVSPKERVSFEDFSAFPAPGAFRSEQRGPSD